MRTWPINADIGQMLELGASQSRTEAGKTSEYATE
jgi:hypothetical protein